MAQPQGTDISSYRLPVIDTQVSRRNFDGYQEEQFFTLADIQQGDGPGTTETDSKTAPESGGYTGINAKSGSGGRSWKSSSKRS